MIATQAVEVRMLQGKLPVSLREGFAEEWEFDAEWTWVLERDGEIVGMLLGAPCHGIAQMIMLKVLPGNESSAIKLIRAFLRDCLSRGFKGYMVHLNHDSSAQYKLMRIARKAGALVLPYKIVCVGGKLEEAAKW